MVEKKSFTHEEILQKLKELAPLWKTGENEKGNAGAVFYIIWGLLHPQAARKVFSTTANRQGETT